MNEIEIRRVYHPQTTIGELWHKGTLMAYTIELPWRDNKRQVSCIPEGTYTLGRHNGSKFGLCPIVRNVPGRSGILFHAANDADDSDGSAQLQGCIAPVTSVRIGNGTVRGIESTTATKVINELIFKLIADGGCQLKITRLDLNK